MINNITSLSQKFFQIAVRNAIPRIEIHRVKNDIPWKLRTLKRNHHQPNHLRQKAHLYWFSENFATRPTDQNFLIDVATSRGYSATGGGVNGTALGGTIAGETDDQLLEL